MTQSNGNALAATDPHRRRAYVVENDSTGHQTDDDDSWDPTEAFLGGRHGGLGTHHRKAAFHYETAAHHHREAARHAGAGNREDAQLHAQAAHTHGKAAREHELHTRGRGHWASSAGEGDLSLEASTGSIAPPEPSSARRIPNGHGYDDDRGLGESVAPVGAAESDG